MNILLLSLHGLIRGSDLQVGLDADNGGQIVYVMELARALSAQPEVDRVHVMTRLVDDPRLDRSYAAPVEAVSEKLDIRRVRCGGERYLPKEQLYPHLDEFVASALDHVRRERLCPDWLHSHYADAGYAAARMSRALDVPFAHTAHSLGRRKLEKLLATGMLEAEAMERFRFAARFRAEEEALAAAAFVVCSTKQEVGSYHDYARAGGARFIVLPPGVDLERYRPYYEEERSDEEEQARASLHQELGRFLRRPDKPLVIALCRPDQKKNLRGLVEAYGTDRQLRALANLAIFAGMREDVGAMAPLEAEVIRDLLALGDKLDLYGDLAMPKRHDATVEAPVLYRLAASGRGVFANVAFTEPFGLTLLEAAASGLPVVATDQGGPSEIVPRLQNGILVSPHDRAAIQLGLRELLLEPRRWKEASLRGIRNVRALYGWSAHARRYVELVREHLAPRRPRRWDRRAAPREERSSRVAPESSRPGRGLS